MNDEINQKLENISTKVEEIYQDVKKTKKYFLWTLIITIVMVVVPLILLAFAIPAFVSNYVSVLEGI